MEVKMRAGDDAGKKQTTAAVWVHGGEERRRLESKKHDVGVMLKIDGGGAAAGQGCGKGRGAVVLGTSGDRGSDREWRREEAAMIDEDWDADGGCAGWLCSWAFELGIGSDGSRHECRGLKHDGGVVIAYGHGPEVMSDSEIQGSTGASRWL
ncbi:hypothetical protein M0R45_025813 [Rubus argutus]|uniref:Uncharacterized protein n=1 Tax=Rubus argutus TaxID=59490 RepID=A0AAW1WXB1_RUBAR